jgi:1-acyl-sn-glycerol-3-phosphate acyltransferase
MAILALLRTIISRFLLLLIMIVFFIPTLILVLMPDKWRHNNRGVYFFVDIFYRLVLRSALVPITYEGLENVPQGPAIYAANHQSSLDIPLVGRLVKGRPHMWLATYELMQSPILRWIVPRLAVIVDTRSPMRAMRCIIRIIRLVNGTNQDLMIFPEGGRFDDGQIHAFFGGFVILAKKMGLPVVPVCLIGANKVYPPSSFIVHWHPIRVVVGKPFMYGEHDTDETFKTRVRDWFVETIRSR